MRNNIEEILDKCLNEIESGKSIDDVLKEYPDDAEELRSLLNLTEELGALPGPALNSSAPMRQMATLVMEAQAKSNKFFRRPNVIFRVAASFILFSVFAFGTVFASSNSVPGDLLYPIKILTEDVQFFLSFNNQDKAELKIVFSNQRLKEALKKSRTGKVDTELLKEMLDEARKALKYSSELEGEEKKDILREFSSLVLYQEGTLKQLYNKSSQQDQKILAPFACACDTRYKMLIPILEKNEIDPLITKKESQDHDMIDCGCKPGAPCKASKAEMKKWQDIYYCSDK